MSIQGVS